MFHFTVPPTVVTHMYVKGDPRLLNTKSWASLIFIFENLFNILHEPLFVDKFSNNGNK